MRRIAVLTSGGDAPGMNAAIRAVVRTGLHMDIEVYGVYRGYEGLITGDIQQLFSHDVSNILQRGGTILHSARSQSFKTVEGRSRAYEHLISRGIEGLIVIGGDGTFTGANIFQQEHQFPIVGLPGTIDNDLYGTDYTIGYDTAINTAMQAIDKIKDTADAHNRLFFVEVMGRDAGFIALRTGIATGAEAVLVPETITTTEALVASLEEDYANNKTSGIVVVAEGDESGGAMKIAEEVKSRLKHYEIRVTILGHIQRGGSPTCMERVRASKMGYEAVKALVNGQSGVMVGIMSHEIVYTPFEKSIKHHHSLSPGLLELVQVLG